MSGKRIAILGAGPIGIEAALYARTLGHQVVIYDRGQVADNVQKWGFVRLFTTWRMNATPLGRRAVRLPDAKLCPTGAELRDKYLLPLSLSPILRDCLRLDTRVISVRREGLEKLDAIASADHSQSPFRVLVSDATDHERIDHADVVLDCTGTYGNNRWPGRGGVPAAGEMSMHQRIWYTIPNVLGAQRQLFANRHTLLIGCGLSAATVLADIEKLYEKSPQTRVSWCIRRPGQALREVEGDPLEPRRALVSRIHALAVDPPAWLNFLGVAVLEELAPSGARISATLRCLDAKRVLQIDELAAMVGYAPEIGIYEQLQLPEPNFFILGAKSYGTDSHFLLQIGHKQIVDAFSRIQDDPTLNLYES